MQTDDYLKPIERGPGITTMMRPLKVLGMTFGRRMVILQNEKGECMIHSPFPIQPGMEDPFASLGPVKRLITPTTFHDTFLQDAIDFYTEADPFVARGMKAPFDRLPTLVHMDTALSGWEKDLTPIQIRGIPLLNEVVFIHKPSQSLLVSDLVFNLGSWQGGYTRMFASLLGFSNTPGPSRLFRSVIKTMDSFKQSLNAILEHPFESIIPSHFDVVETRGPDVIKAIRDRL